MNNINPFIKWWVTPKLPKEHIFLNSDKYPKNPFAIINIYFKKWLIHPVKRRVAKYYLIFLRKSFGLKVIGITGSAGKTTTKEMLTSILKLKGKTIFSYANIDPIYNIPSTILKCDFSTKFLILEMGVEYPGEMDFYLWLAKPDISIITNIYETHLEFFKNKEGVYEEKRKIAINLKENDYVVLNSDNEYTSEILKITKAKSILFGGEGELKAKDIKLDLTGTKFTLEDSQGKISIQLPILGKQFVENALAASATAEILRIDRNEIKQGLERFNPQEHRMRVNKLKNGAILIDDSYNNNPKAAIKALDTLEEIAAKREVIIVFGDMLELGVFEQEAHRKIGEIISKMKIKNLIGVGKASLNTVDEVKKKMGEKAFWVSSSSEVLPILKPLINSNSLIFVKGSRSVGLDRVVSQLL